MRGCAADLLSAMDRNPIPGGGMAGALYSDGMAGVLGEAPGNFPQAFTHLALMRAAFNLDRALNKRR